MIPQIVKNKFPDSLTERQKEILECILLGMSNEEMAHKLNIEYSTAKLMSYKVLHKIGLKTKMQALAKFLAN